MPSSPGLRPLLQSTAARAADFLESLDSRPVAPTATPDELRAPLLHSLPDEPLTPEDALTQLVRAVEPGLVASAGPRYFGFVIGGSTPASLAADWLTSAWDQNAQVYSSSPAAALVEETVARWILDLLHLPATASVGFVTGCQMANFTALAAARNTLLARAGWDPAARGLFGAPAIRVLLSEEAHATVRNALSLLGFGSEQLTPLPCDDQGRLLLSALSDELDCSSAPVIVSAQAGNVNTGAFEPLPSIAPLLAGRNAWLHVDGAFGLWAAASPRLRHLVEGLELADSWATDAHKWLNVPYDSGLVIVRDPAHHATLKSARCAYSGPASASLRDPSAWTPENSRRARAFPLYAALLALGRQGLAELLERHVDLARNFADHAARLPHTTILNDVALNQVLFRIEPPLPHDSQALHAALAHHIQAEGHCWLGPTTWRGRAALRLSISNWSTRQSDVDTALVALARAIDAVLSRPPA